MEIITVCQTAQHFLCILVLIWGSVTNKGTEKHMSQLTIGWTVQGWKPGEGEIFHTHPDQPPV